MTSRLLRASALREVAERLARTSRHHVRRHVGEVRNRFEEDIANADLLPCVLLPQVLAQATERATCDRARQRVVKSGEPPPLLTFSFSECFREGSTREGQALTARPRDHTPCANRTTCAREYPRDLTRDAHTERIDSGHRSRMRARLIEGLL